MKKIMFQLLLLAAVSATGLTGLAQGHAPAPVSPPPPTIGGHLPPPPAASPAKKVKRGGDTKIKADLLNYDFSGRRIIYTGHVHIENPDMKLYCAKITSYSPPDNGHPYRIVAEADNVQTNVIIDMLDDKGQTNHVTGRLAVYDYQVENGATNETVTITGDPHIASPMITGTADQLKWDRGTGNMSAINPDFTSTQQLELMAARTNTPAAK